MRPAFPYALPFLDKDRLENPPVKVLAGISGECIMKTPVWRR
jgi:hypothetical protein